MLNVLIIGSGGREHAIAKKCAESPQLGKLFTAPGNPGTAQLGTNVDIKDTDIDQLLTFALENAIDLTIVGPEAPLVLGIVDTFQEKGLKIVGPSKHNARLEGSKKWAKEKMKQFGVPTAEYEVFTEYDQAKDYLLSKNTYPIVIKADGLAAGKGVTVAQSENDAITAIKECLVNKKFSQAGAQVVIEEFLEGEEASVFAITDGTTVLPMEPAQDHKALKDGDTGPNTGGMGAYCPAPIMGETLKARVYTDILRKMIDGLREEGTPYQGILYAGLMIDKDKNAKVVEFNARFGDPETQIVLPRLKDDLLALLHSIAQGEANTELLQWHPGYCVSVVLASEGYPESYEKGKTITINEGAIDTQTTDVIHAGTKQIDDTLVTNGGRVLNILGKGDTIEDAIENAYKGVDQVNFDGKTFRKDIGQKAVSLLNNPNYSRI